jgi:hypothetical protein
VELGSAMRERRVEVATDSSFFMDTAQGIAVTFVAAVAVVSVVFFSWLLYLAVGTGKPVCDDLATSQKLQL